MPPKQSLSDLLELHFPLHSRSIYRDDEGSDRGLAIKMDKHAPSLSSNGSSPYSGGPA
jgi:hypothetical protein